MRVVILAVALFLCGCRVVAPPAPGLPSTVVDSPERKIASANAILAQSIYSATMATIAMNRDARLANSTTAEILEYMEKLSKISKAIADVQASGSPILDQRNAIKVALQFVNPASYLRRRVADDNPGSAALLLTVDALQGAVAMMLLEVSR